MGILIVEVVELKTLFNIQALSKTHAININH